MNVFICAICLYALVAAKALIPVLSVKISLRILGRFIYAFDNHHPYGKELKKALRRYPAIKRYAKASRIGHDLNDFANKYNSQIICKELQNVEDVMIYEFWKKILPFNAAKEILLFPVNAFAFFFGKPRKKGGLISWVIDATGCAIIAYLVGKLLDQLIPADFFRFLNNLSK